MAQTQDGARKGAARRMGISVEEYEAHLLAGRKHCTICKAWHQLEAFGADASRSDGLAASCMESIAKAQRDRYVKKGRKSKLGAFFVPARDGDAEQARARVNHMVKVGLLPHPGTLPCTDCGHVFDGGRPRHEYDHHLGYAVEHHFSVQAVCRPCHDKRSKARGEGSFADKVRDDAGRFAG